MKGKYFLDIPGGTGKKFLINLLLAKVRFDKKKLPLLWLRTAHSTVKLPLKIYTHDVSSICNISKQNNAGKLMKDCSLQILGGGFYVS